MPARFDVCGLLLALSLTLSVAVVLPNAVGVKLTLIVHLLWAARLVVHVVADTAKSPVVEIAMLLNVTLWLLVRVKVLSVLVVPTAHIPKAASGGVSAAGSAPVPVSAEVWGLLLALSLTLSVPVLLPNAVGVKFTLTVHARLAARVVVQVVADTAKSPVVEIAMPLSVTLW